MDNQHRRIRGYRDLTENELAMMNLLKTDEEWWGPMLARIEDECRRNDPEALRWVELARTHLETGYMFALKAIARPTTGLGRRSK